MKTTFVNRINLSMDKHVPSNRLQDRARFLSSLCNVTVQAARKWLSGDSLPDISNLLIISQRLLVTVSYLIGEVDMENISPLSSDKGLENLLGKGFIVDIDETMASNTIITGDSAFCVPSSKDEVFDGYTYLLKIGNNSIFRVLFFDGSRLTSIYEENGVEAIDVYTDTKVIELTLASVVARVEKTLIKEGRRAVNNRL